MGEQVGRLLLQHRSQQRRRPAARGARNAEGSASCGGAWGGALAGAAPLGPAQLERPRLLPSGRERSRVEGWRPAQRTGSRCTARVAPPDPHQGRCAGLGRSQGGAHVAAEFGLTAAGSAASSSAKRSASPRTISPTRLPSRARRWTYSVTCAGSVAGWASKHFITSCKLQRASVWPTVSAPCRGISASIAGSTSSSKPSTSATASELVALGGAATSAAMRGARRVRVARGAYAPAGGGREAAAGHAI